MLAATLGRHEQADEDFALACDFHNRNGVRTWEARSELGWAEALAERGDLDRAREHASRALESHATTVSARSNHARPRSWH